VEFQDVTRTKVPGTFVRAAEGQLATAPWGLRWLSGRPGALCLSPTNAAPRHPSPARQQENPSLAPRVPIEFP
jgi:hypothetical protein